MEPGYLVSAIGVLGTAIGVLWKFVHETHKRQVQELEALKANQEKARNRELELVKDNAAMGERVASIDGKIEGYLEAKSDLQELSQTVIEIVDEKRQTDSGSEETK